MANDYGYLGALSSISEGAGSFLNAYQTAKNMKHQQQMAELAAGVTRDENGNLVPNAQKQAMNAEQMAQLQRNAEGRDAASQRSQNARRINQGILIAIGGNPGLINDQMSEADIKDETGPVQTYIKGKFGMLGRQASNDYKNSVHPKDWMTFNQELDPNRARTGNLGAVQKTINASDRLKALFDQFPDGNVPKSQSTELATGVAAMISGGSPQSQQQIHDLIPQSFAGNAADAISWALNNPTGREQKAFIQGLKDTMMRERATAVHQLHDAQRQKLVGYEHMRATDPERYQGILHNWHLDEQDPEIPPPGGAGAVDPATAAKMQELQALRAKAGIK